MHINGFNDIFNEGRYRGKTVLEVYNCDIQYLYQYANVKGCNHRTFEIIDDRFRDWSESRVNFDPFPIIETALQEYERAMNKLIQYLMEFLKEDHTFTNADNERTILFGERLYVIDSITSKMLVLRNGTDIINVTPYDMDIETIKSVIQVLSKLGVNTYINYTDDEYHELRDEIIRL
jgi:hypothetical protein